MRLKRVVGILCAATVLLANGNMLVHAENLNDVDAISTEVENTDGEDIVLGENIISLGSVASVVNENTDTNLLNEVANNIQLYTAESSEAELYIDGNENFNFDSVTSIGTILSDGTRSTNSITQSFTDYITEEGSAKLVQFSLSEGQIFNASLKCPDNANLDYDLVLASVEDDGSLTYMTESSLGTYFNTDTDTTVDEGISYVHNQATIGNFAILVMATTGSSSTNSFTLTVSIDTVGSYDNNEPNDSPFTATSMSSLTTAGSLHVVNDQDWYVVSMTSGLYNISAGDYEAEIYYATTGNKMVAATKAGNNYLLGNGTYYVRVFSDATQDDFTFGDYTLQITDASVYSSLETAFDFGTWENSYMKLPDVMPKGQQEAYYKFTIDAEDKAYASFIIHDGGSGTFIEFLNEKGEMIDYGFTGSTGVNLAARGVITKSSSSLKYLVVNIDGSDTNSIGYIRVTRVDPLDISAGGTPSINKRIYSGYDTFKFSGTAKNSGGSVSNVLSLDLTNSSKIPAYAVVDRIATSSSISYSVGGVYHQLYLTVGDTADWLQSKTSNATSGSFDMSGAGVPAKQVWQFRYSQTALKSTQMTSVQMKIYWDYDIQYTNYELFK